MSDTQAPAAADRQADAIVVGAGPAGSAAAYHMAGAGLDVLLLEKAEFPRDKVCGDGLTPRGVRQVVAMGIDTSTEAGWLRNHGLRVIGGGVRLELPWPELASFPDYGLVRRRTDFDELLAGRAQKMGARLQQGTNVTAPVFDVAGRVAGVQTKDGATYRAPVVLAADGGSSRLGLAVGLRKRADRPMGVAVRRYYRSPRHDDDWLESWLELWDGLPGAERQLPGYGWVFGMGDGTSNVGIGLLDSSADFQHIDYRGLLRRWVAGMPEEWGFVEEQATGPIRGSALPMAFNRQPHYSRGLMLVGDSGGMVNPFNGEGIAYAMEAGALAAEVVVQALARSEGAAREKALSAYPAALKDTYGGYYTLGRAFVKLIGNDAVMRFCTQHGLPRPALMRILLKLMANLSDPRGGDATDRLLNALSRLTPAA